MQIQTADLAWSPTSTPGIEEKPLHSGNPADRHHSRLVRLAPGTTLPPQAGDLPKPSTNL
ncbi:MAG TPA: hypothetical protein P5218_00635 [Planctomycetota bacterium]|nr:hypothetical protein [Planctomycetota bacterium]HRV79906.1 hypothetical protein [Planctomycetota bacterium]